MNPLRAFIYKEGLARFATEKYMSPQGSNLNNLCMHLTNYAINKEAEGFVQNQNEAEADVGHKRSLTAILDHIDKHRKSDQDPTGDEVWEDIKQVCVKTLMAGIHPIANCYKSARPHDVENSLCFHVLGIDIFLDSQSKCWLIEVNQSPSFMTDSPLDYNIKKNLIRDTLHILNLNWKRKNRYLREHKNEMANRLTGKGRLTPAEKEALKAKKTRIKDKFENNNMGDYQNLFPLKRGVNPSDEKLMEKYDYIYKKSKEVFDESVGGKLGARFKKEQEEALNLQKSVQTSQDIKDAAKKENYSLTVRKKQS